MSFFEANSIPGDSCDDFTTKPRRIPSEIKCAELPEHLTILLYDSGIPLQHLPRASELMAEAYKSGHADGRSDGIQAVVDDPGSYFDGERDEP